MLTSQPSTNFKECGMTMSDQQGSDQPVKKLSLIRAFACRLNILYIYIYIRVPTSSGNHGKPGKSPKKVPCMEKSWNLKKPE